MTVQNQNVLTTQAPAMPGRPVMPGRVAALSARRAHARAGRGGQG